MSEFTIRRAVPGDWSAIEALRVSAMSRSEHFPGVSASFASLREESASPNSLIFLAEKEGKIVGLRSVGNLNHSSPSLRSVFVLDAERHSGLGKALTLHALKEVFSLDHVKTVSGRLLEEDELRLKKARAHYESMGFTVEPSGDFRISREAWLKAELQKQGILPVHPTVQGNSAADDLDPGGWSD